MINACFAHLSHFLPLVSSGSPTKQQPSPTSPHMNALASSVDTDTDADTFHIHPPPVKEVISSSSPSNKTSSQRQPQRHLSPLARRALERKQKLSISLTNQIVMDGTLTTAALTTSTLGKLSPYKAYTTANTTS
jgi:Flp pilus assembly protein TadD